MYIGVQAEKKRKQNLTEFANGLGLQYFEELPAVDANRFQTFQLANKGRGQKASSAIIADSGQMRMVIFDYKFVTGSGKNKSTHRQSVVMSSGQELQAPDFSIAPEGFLHRIGDFFGFKDIDFEDDQAFSDQFLLNGPDETAIREYFTADRRRAFLKYKDISVEASNNSFIYHCGLRKASADEIKQLMERSFEIYQILKSEEAETSSLR